MASAPRSHSRRPSHPILAALCVVLAGCGGAESAPKKDGDAAEIQSAVERLLESESVSDQCETGVSERFVREVYVTIARCREANEPTAEDDRPDTATTFATRIDADRATTGVTLASVKGASATGRLALAKVAGAWKVDRLGVDFVRSLFAALPEQAQTSQDRLILQCLAQATHTLSDRDVRRVGNLMIGRRLAPNAFPPSALRCIQRQSRSTRTT